MQPINTNINISNNQFNSDDILNYKQGNQAQVKEKDNRKQVKNANIYPYTALGKVIAIFTIQNIGKNCKKFGTGCLIQPGVVLTAAHVIYSDTYKQADNIYYQPSYNKFQQYKVIKIYTNDKYFKNQQKYDYTILLLQRFYDFPRQNKLTLLFNYKRQKYQNKNILIAGYPSQQNTEQGLYQEDGLLQCHHGKYPQFICYKHTTYGGNSGGPILFNVRQQNKQKQVKIDKQQQKKQLVIIGTHKGNKGQYNYGILVDKDFIQRSKQQISKYVIENKIQQIMQREFKSFGRYILINPFLINPFSLINKLFTK